MHPNLNDHQEPSTWATAWFDHIYEEDKAPNQRVELCKIWAGQWLEGIDRDDGLWFTGCDEEFGTCRGLVNVFAEVSAEQGSHTSITRAAHKFLEKTFDSNDDEYDACVEMATSISNIPSASLVVETAKAIDVGKRNKSNRPV